MMKRTFLTLLICISTGLGSGSGAVAATPGEVEIGEILPETLLKGLNGPSRQLSAFRGQPLIINVWASWCGPCRMEMASLERLAWLDESQAFNVIGISTDDYPARAEAALRAGNATIANFIDSQLRVEHMLGATRLPLTVLVDKDGRVLKKHYGARAWDAPDARAWIASVFGLLPGY